MDGDILVCLRLELLDERAFEGCLALVLVGTLGVALVLSDHGALAGLADDVVLGHCCLCLIKEQGARSKDLLLLSD